MSNEYNYEKETEIINQGIIPYNTMSPSVKSSKTKYKINCKINNMKI